MTTRMIPIKRKEAGHYSGLNENRHSKIILTRTAVESLHTVNCHYASNNKKRIAYPGILACHQMWVHGWGQGFVTSCGGG